MDAIFETVEQALHVSFMVISLPSRQKNPMRTALIRALESVGNLTSTQAATLDYLRGSRSEGGYPNFSGLNGDEVRAQCSMVVAAVNDHLSGDERCAVWVRYARGIPSQPAKAGMAANVSVPPSTEWKRGMFALAGNFRELVGIQDRNTIMALIAGHAFPHQREAAFSYEIISQHSGIPIRTLSRAALKIRKRLVELEVAAALRLAPMFQRDGLVLNEQEEEPA